MTIDPKRVKEVFLEAAALPDEAARAAYLDKACGADAGVRERVEALLRYHDPKGSFLGTPAAVVPDPDHASAQTLTTSADHAAASATEPARTEALSGAVDALRAGLGPPTTETEEEPLTFLTPPQRPDSLGRIGHYEVLQILGKGGFGVVFRAFDELLQRVVALKVMAPQLAATSPARKRFLREARSSAQVRHENVVQVYEVAEQPLPYLAMEFIPGETLQQKLDRVGPLDVSETLRIGRQIAEGLAAAHATDLIHRDIKPGNVLLEGGQHKVKITDFGLARAADDASISQSGIIAGTPMYMAPEQALGQTLDQRADLFSLGSVLYQMVAGRPPFRANGTLAVLKRVAEDKPRAIREIIPETPPWLCDIIAKLHAKNPDDRYQSARQVADVLADCEEHLKSKVKLKNFSRIPRGKPQRSWRRKWIGVVLLLLPLLALGVLELTGVTHLLNRQSEGWVQLFNGKDLTGWKTHPDQPGQWKVEDGVLIGSAVPSYLYSEGGHFVDFHLRIEARINNGGDSGIYLRTPFATMRPGKDRDLRPAGGYEVELQENPTYLVKTGSVLDAGTSGAPKSLWINHQASSTRPDEWFTMEIIAQGNHFVTKVNGTRIADCLDPRNHFTSGHIALQVFSPLTIVQFRKIEIKELTPVPSVPSVKGAEVTSEDIRPLRITPWSDSGDWALKGQEVHQRKSSGDWHHLLFGNPAWTDYDFEVEVKILEPGEAAVQFRATTSRDMLGAVLGAFSNTRYAVIANFDGIIHRFTALAQVPGQTEEDRWYKMRVQARGDVFKVFLDGRPLMSARSDKYPHGCVGLAAKTIACFRNLKVTDPSGKVLLEGVQNVLPKPASAAIAPFTDADVQRIAALPAAEQVEVVRKELKRRNPGFDGKIEHKIEGGVVTEFKIVTDNVTDIAPIRVFDALRVLECTGTYSNGLLADLRPLQAMNLAALTRLALFNNTKVSDAGMATFKDCRNLSYLNLGNTPVTNAGLIHFKNCKVLTHLLVGGTKVSDSGLAYFRGMPLRMLWISKTGITDLTPLQGVQLEDIRLTPKNITRGLDIIRHMKSLKTIGVEWNQAWPAAEFWERYDRGEFK